VDADPYQPCRETPSVLRYFLQVAYVLMMCEQSRLGPERSEVVELLPYSSLKAEAGPTRVTPWVPFPRRAGGGQFVRSPAICVVKTLHV